MLLFKVEAVVPYSRGDLLSRVHELGACDVEEYTDAGTLIQVWLQSRPPADEKAPFLYCLCSSAPSPIIVSIRFK